MTDFDKILKDAIQGFEAPYDPQMWNKVSSQLSPMEDAVRDAVESYEAPYDAKAWSAVKKQLGGSQTVLKWVAGSAATIGLIAGVIAFTPEQEPIVETPVVITDDSSDPVVIADLTPANTEEQGTIEMVDPTVESENTGTTTENNATENGVSDTHENTVNHSIINSQDNTLASTAQDNNTEITDRTDQSLPPASNNTPEQTTPNDNSPADAINYHANFSADNLAVCLNEEIAFVPELNADQVIYQWNFGDGTTVMEQSPSHRYAEAGNYTVTLMLKDKATQETLASAREFITVNPNPNAAFTWEKNNQIIPTITFTSEVDATDVTWRIDGAIVSDRDIFEHTFRQKGNHLVELTTVNSSGCVSQTEEQIEFKNDYNLFAPNAFTPNGDGRNDTFIPEALKLVNNPFTMVIYDQAGRLVFQSNSINDPWDGRNINDNTAVQDGAYVWLVQLQNGNGTTDEYKGQVFVTR